MKFKTPREELERYISDSKKFGPLMGFNHIGAYEDLLTAMDELKKLENMLKEVLEETKYNGGLSIGLAGEIKQAITPPEKG